MLPEPCKDFTQTDVDGYICTGNGGIGEIFQLKKIEGPVSLEKLSLGSLLSISNTFVQHALHHLLVDCLVVQMGLFFHHKGLCAGLIERLGNPLGCDDIYSLLKMYVAT